MWWKMQQSEAEYIQMPKSGGNLQIYGIKWVELLKYRPKTHLK
jgi:hypothetical protein